MSKDALLKRGDDVLLPITKYENVLDAPQITDVLTTGTEIPTSRAVKTYVDQKTINIDPELVGSSI
jgi:hypothetical protein